MAKTRSHTNVITMTASLTPNLLTLKGKMMQHNLSNVMTVKVRTESSVKGTKYECELLDCYTTKV